MKAKRLQGKRTIIFATLAAILPLIDVARELVDIFLSTPEFGAIIPREYYPYYALTVAIGTGILRRMTTTPVGKKD